LKPSVDFDSVFVKSADKIFEDRLFSERPQERLVNGFQTAGNIFDQSGALLETAREVLQTQVMGYLNRFKKSEEGFIEKWPTDFTLFGWLIKMKSGGSLLPHMHERGWISGTVYINVPEEKVKDSGNLVVCLEDEGLIKTDVKNQKKIVNVSTADICLFPASLLHYTIPFKSNKERIVLAFDVIPKKD